MSLRSPLAALLLAALALPGWSNEAVIRKKFETRVPPDAKLEILPTPINGLFELQVGHEVYYTDAQGNYLIRGELIDLEAQRNLTQERVARLTAIDFASLPLKDAIVMKNGNGKRRIAVFADPNCGYCKRFERDVQQVKDVTVYTFLYPVPIGPDSESKSRDVWCAKDRLKAWQDLMLRGIAPPPAPAGCDWKAVTRSTELARKHRISGTPALIFEDGTRIPGALNTAQIEQQLAQVKAR
ncbi:DsbC family protein [Caldimonas sp.]|uniref:DsbC family protein n=1 Tax=Caldimonas sp. TaxID=2838790 RepID=UPI003919047E